MSKYYDLDAILTDAQKLPCTFELNVPGLGYLDGNAGGDLKQGTRVDLPLWLGEMLAVAGGAASSTGPLVTLDFPSSLSLPVINALKASPQSVDLRAQSPHFYALGARVLELFDDEEVADVLLDTFKDRASTIADHAHNARSGGSVGTSEGQDFLRGLDEMERKLFRAAHDGAKNVREWERNVTTKN